MKDSFKSESVREEFTDGPWVFVITENRLVTFYPRDRKKLPRNEFILPSGQRLIQDICEGFVWRSEYYARADIKSRTPKGRAVGTRKIKKLQQQGLEWFKFNYQDIYSEEDKLISSNLKSIERHSGLALIEEIEINA